MVWSTFWRSRKKLTNLPKLSCGFKDLICLYTIWYIPPCLEMLTCMDVCMYVCVCHCLHSKALTHFMTFMPEFYRKFMQALCQIHLWLTYARWPYNQGGISSSILSVFFTDKFALSQSDARISVAYKICQWKTLTKCLMKCPPGEKL